MRYFVRAAPQAVRAFATEGKSRRKPEWVEGDEAGALKQGLAREEARVCLLRESHPANLRGHPVHGHARVRVCAE